MKIINTGSVRIRVEGYGYVMPGRSIDVPEDTGRQLCREGSNFREVKRPLSAAEISSAVAKKSVQEVRKPAPKRTRSPGKKGTRQKQKGQGIRQKGQGIRQKGQGTRDKAEGIRHKG